MLAWGVVCSTTRPEVVYNLLRKLKTNKATGLDNTPARLPKDGVPVISECLTRIINRSYFSGVIPAGWKTSRVVPLFKCGNREEMDKYRVWRDQTTAAKETTISVVPMYFIFA